MSYVRYAGIDCACPKCWNKPSFDFPACHIHIRWSNQYGAAITIFCENCQHSHDMCMVSGNLIVGLSRKIEKPLYNWKSREWKIERLEYLTRIRAIMVVSYKNDPSINIRYDEEIAILEKHLRA